MRELYKLIGKQGVLKADGFDVPVKIEDVRQVFGRVDVEVSSDYTYSTRWVALERVTVNEDS